MYLLSIILLKAFCFYFYHRDLFPLANRQIIQKKVTINHVKGNILAEAIHKMPEYTN